MEDNIGAVYKISDIEKVYPNWYNPNHELSYDVQKFIWENAKLPPEDEQKLNRNGANESVTLNGSVIGGRKRTQSNPENLSKLQAIERLKHCNYRTPPREVASYLEIIFGRWEENPGIWLRIAQFHHPKTINGVIAQMIKAHRRGDKKFQYPARYFVATIKKKSNRMSLRRTNGGRKQQLNER